MIRFGLILMFALALAMPAVAYGKGNGKRARKAPIKVDLVISKYSREIARNVERHIEKDPFEDRVGKNRVVRLTRTDLMRPGTEYRAPKIATVPKAAKKPVPKVKVSEAAPKKNGDALDQMLAHVSFVLSGEEAPRKNLDREIAAIEKKFKEKKKPRVVEYDIPPSMMASVAPPLDLPGASALKRKPSPYKFEDRPRGKNYRKISDEEEAHMP